MIWRNLFTFCIKREIDVESSALLRLQQCEIIT